METVVIAALYHFAPLEATEAFRRDLFDFCAERGIKGTLLLASEGINGTVAGSRESIDALLRELRGLEGFERLVHKESFFDKIPFRRMKVRLKKEIVTLGVPGTDPNRVVGTYVSPEEWNDLIANPDVLVIDTRNSFEYECGTFTRAVDPETESFREFPAYVERELMDNPDRPIAMFCTGGIRCEKATSYMIDRGFRNVFHLEGGILRYLEEVPQEKSLWEGECFVFDQRTTVDHDLQKGTYELCLGCGHVLSGENRRHEDFEAGVKCEFCAAYRTAEQFASARERNRQMMRGFGGDHNVE
jgi:UPF0176 protein